MNFPSLFRNRIKERALNNTENMLDIMGKTIKGVKQCPLMMGVKCIGPCCQFFNEYTDIDRKTKEKKSFWACDHNMTPRLLMELNANIREFITALKKGTE